jgi:hypothetical protein
MKKNRKTTPCKVFSLRRRRADPYWFPKNYYPHVPKSDRGGELMTTQNRMKGSRVKPEYKRTPRETEAVGKFRKGYEKGAPRLKTIKSGDRPRLVPDHPDDTTGYILLMEALGTTDFDFLNSLLGQLANVGSPGRDADEQGTNFMLSVVKGIGPRDQVEAMLAAQMAAVHSATMTFARRLGHVENIPQQDSAERAFNKLARTFTTQMEALKRYRTGGEQKVTVQHVTVGEGGQAIVGNVTQGRDGTAPGGAATPPLALTKNETAPMPIVESKMQTPVQASRTSKKK